MIPSIEIINSGLSRNLTTHLFSESAYTVDEKDLALPRIPIHPIGYDDAYQLLK